ncbi:hypothetical protein M2459_001916 [Parabacteroides sp. PF5-5]|uniref:hypothetical protein n=1 Tax=unclassified Parabacteroides TaxID=2649774 RepID=UPI002476CCE8|nr:MULTISPECIES: hypothetical protein [unclassified Parabacteroides]MDH6305463.1 hypothetical protein [Parabacteroides sp. PH5-39]MDH6316173.1 hypothetical protein [Parabacteroides sp. PF5-13]MDH6320323.1 hypothetical protein [Parabacteroides sp. PH5-13]MDH6324053.1 hypothetical protein [Parabacteroides sp. PH5-8]MDH6327364.1 hypothetical protein [Parabacteroides sp. PH5-41]
MESKFNISDIIRYMLIGLFFTLSAVFLHWAYSDFSLIDYLKNLLFFLGEVSNFSIMFLLLLIFYLLGIIIQGVNKMIISFCVDLEIQEERDDIKFSSCKRFIINLLYSFFYKITPEAQCVSLKKEDKLNVPEWINISKNPSMLMEHIKLKMEIKKAKLKETTLNINEYFHFSELFQGIYLSSVILLLISILSLMISAIILIVMPLSASHQLVLRLIFLVLAFSLSAFVSYFLSYTYATRGIMTLDIKKEALNIDISKNIKKTGIQQVHVLIRTHRPKLKESKYENVIDYQLEYLEEAIESVGIQDYYKINVLLLGNPYCDFVDKKVKELSKKYKSKLSIQYCYEKNESIAHSSRSIRNQILDIADDDDIIMFLNDDDTLCRDNAISEIVSRMNSLNADLCLSAFKVDSKTDENLIIENGRLHNLLVKKLSRHNKSITIKGDESVWHFASTISWTKIYRAKLLKQLNNITKEIKEPILEKLVAFEDFMDYLVFLQNEIKVTAVDEPVYSYRKHDKGYIHKKNENAFKELRIGYLGIVKGIAELVYLSEDKDCCNNLLKNGVDSKERIKLTMCDKVDLNKTVYCYLGYKIYEIGNIVEKYNKEGVIDKNNYNRDDFIKDCKNKLGKEYCLYWEKSMENKKEKTNDTIYYYDEMVRVLEDYSF